MKNIFSTKAVLILATTVLLATVSIVAQTPRLDFTGLEIGNKESEILLNHQLFSFAAKEGSAILFPHPSGMNLTISSASHNEVGVIADADSASLYAASPKWEVDVSVDKAGTHIVRGPKPKSD